MPVSRFDNAYSRYIQYSYLTYIYHSASVPTLRNVLEDKHHRGGQHPLAEYQAHAITIV